MPPTKMTKVWYRSYNRSIWVSVIAGIVVVGILLGMRYSADYRQSVHLLEERLMAQAHVVDENLTANLYSISLILENSAHEINIIGANQGEELTRYLKIQCNSLPGIRTLLVTDSDGRCTSSNREELVGQDFSTRNYFTIPRDAPDKSLTFMSPPFKTVLGNYVISISKPLIGKRGEFKGVLTISLSPEYFQTLLKSTLYAPDNRIALIHSGGTVFTAMPDGTKSIIGQNLLKSSSLYVQHVRDGRTRSVQSGRSSTTGDTRVFAYIDNKPKDLRFNKYLVVAASRNLDEALVPWKMDTALDVLLYLFTSATILLVTRIQLRRSVELSKLHATQDSILESAGDGILGLDRSGTILFCNQAAGRLTGKGRTELIGHNFHQALHSDSAGHDSADCPLRVTLKDGVKRTVNDCMLANLGSVEYTVTPLFEQNEVAGVVIVFRDVTEQRKMEAVSRQALETATTANVTMSRLMNVVAHEFRTPLGLLTGSTDILDRYWDRLTPEKRLEQNAHIRSAASQISSLVNSVISFNQAGRDGAMQQALVTDLEDACRSIVAEIETVWSAGHLFRCTVVTDGSPLLLDQSLFQRILKNLLSNAFRYTSPAGTISLSVCREKNQLLLEVTDTGIGIPEEDQKLIFDPFYRSSNVEDRRGLGLGLSIVNDALAKLGGTITLLSNVGEGTTVTVKLPVIESIEE